MKRTAAISETSIENVQMMNTLVKILDVSLRTGCAMVSQIVNVAKMKQIVT